jgi:hypothetical protein
MQSFLKFISGITLTVPSYFNILIYVYPLKKKRKENPILWQNINK